MYEGMPLDLTKDKFPLPVLSKRIAALADSLENGTGERTAQPSSALRAAHSHRCFCSHTPASGRSHGVRLPPIVLKMSSQLTSCSSAAVRESVFSRHGCATPSLAWLYALSDAGAVMICNFPVEGHTEEDIAIMYLGVSAHIGRTVPQSSAGLRSVSRGYGLPLGRVQAEMTGKTPGNPPHLSSPRLASDPPLFFPTLLSPAL
jgi:hypothetical protein